MSSRNLPTPDLVAELAGAAAFCRGAAYAREGIVQIQHGDANGVTALAHGTGTYRVHVRWRNGELAGDCDCPVGLRGEFCKHQVAAALLWIADAATEEAPGAGGAASPSSARRGRRTATGTEAPEAMIERWLQAQSAERLRRLVLSMAGDHPDLWRQLVARARMASASPQEQRKAISELVGRKRFLDYRATIDHARRLRALTALLRERLQSDPMQALDLADHALLRLFALYEESDDSGGAFGEVLREVADLHRQAAQGLSDVDGFAKAWLKLKLADDWGIVDDVDAYVTALGRGGIAWLEKQAGERLDALPPTGSGANRWDERHGERFALLSLLRQIARHGGDVDALLARRERASVNHAVDYLDLHQLCFEHGRERLAIQWLERGAKAFPRDTRLIDALARARHGEGFGEEARELAWHAFELAPDEEHFLALRELAGENGWPQWRQRALAQARSAGAAHDGGDGLVVRLLLAERDIDGIVALLPDVRLPPHLWAKLVPALSPEHPELALRAGRTLVQAAVERTNRSGYKEAIAWLKQMRKLHLRLDDDAGFGRYAAQLRVQYKPKRSFVEMLDAAFLSGY